jgi:hypothetical protein
MQKPKPLGIGIDFSGGKQGAEKTWLAEVGRCPETDQLVLNRLGNRWSHASLRQEIREQRNLPILLDFPLGLAAFTCQQLQIAGSDCWQIWERVANCRDPDDFRAICRGPHSGPGSEGRHKRQIDYLTKTPFAPINLRMYRQTYQGMTQVLLPLGRLPGADQVTVLPWDLKRDLNPNGWLAEGCPASFLKKIGWLAQKYKMPETTNRALLLSQLAGEFTLKVSPRQRKLILEDAAGDALDALILAINACHVSTSERQASWLFHQQHPCEGYVYLGV